MQILQTSSSFIALSTQHPHLHPLSSSNAISISPLSLLTKLSLSLSSPPPPSPSTIIRMGGGPRTYPGGVSKWQWKRMQAKKSKQLLKARLARERQIYDMRKRAELKAAVSDLERPWELVQKATPATSSSLFSVSADEQLKVLADRFQKPGGFDLWSDDDGPQLFHTPDGLPSARFFPKGVVHSVKPYGRISDGNEADKLNNYRGNRADSRNSRRRNKDVKSEGVDENGVNYTDSRKPVVVGSELKGSKTKTSKWSSKGGPNSRRSSLSLSSMSRGSEFEDVYDMSLQGDGTYGFTAAADGRM